MRKKETSNLKQPEHKESAISKPHGNSKPKNYNRYTHTHTNTHTYTHTHTSNPKTTLKTVIKPQKRTKDKGKKKDL